MRHRQRGFFHITTADVIGFRIAVVVVGWLVITALIWVGEHLHFWWGVT